VGGLFGDRLGDFGELQLAHDRLEAIRPSVTCQSLDPGYEGGIGGVADMGSQVRKRVNMKVVGNRQRKKGKVTLVQAFGSGPVDRGIV